MKSVCDEKKIFGDKDLIYLKSLISDTPITGKDKIIRHLRNGKSIAAAAGRARDVFTGEPIKGELLCLSDGEFEWRSDVIYYVDKYNLQLSGEFVEHVLNA